jgi:hypothetical protein
MKKVISLALMCLLLINTPIVMAFSSESPKYDAGEALLRELIDRQLSSITTGVFINIDDITIDTEQMQMYNRFMEWRVVEAVALNTTYSKYDFYINDYSVNPDGLSATAYLNIRVEYANGAGEGGYSNCLQEVEFIQTTDGLKISGYSSQDDMMRDFHDLYNKQLSEVKNPDLLLEIMIEDIYDLAIEMGEVANNPSIEAPIEMTPASIGSCSYNTANGVAYADKYAYTSNPCFVTLSVDCTNFVSQCIWAAYGGWSGGNESTMRTLITNRTYMMSSSSLDNWFGHSSGVSNPWGSVTNLWNFATSNPSVGPKARGNNNGGHYTNVSYLDINPGDVLQIKMEGYDTYSGYNYAHSLYVVSNPKIPQMNYSVIIVAAHTNNGRFTLAEKLATRPMMRQMIFTSATLNTP